MIIMYLSAKVHETSARVKTGQNTQLINVIVVLEVDGEGLSINKSLYRSSREIEICGHVT